MKNAYENGNQVISLFTVEEELYSNYFCPYFFHFNSGGVYISVCRITLDEGCMKMKIIKSSHQSLMKASIFMIIILFIYYNFHFSWSNMNITLLVHWIVPPSQWAVNAGIMPVISGIDSWWWAWFEPQVNGYWWYLMVIWQGHGLTIWYVKDMKPLCSHRNSHCSFVSFVPLVLHICVSKPGQHCFR